MTNKDILQNALNQLAVDYNCSPADFTREGVIFTEAKKLAGQRERPFIETRLEIITMGRDVIINTSKMQAVCW